MGSSEKVNEVLTEMNQIRDRQEDMDGRLEAMKNENEALWGEVMSLRLRHSKQQKIVNKLIQFLVALVQPRGRKRSFQSRMGGGHLALEDTGVGAKLGKRPVGKEFEDIRVELSLQEAATDTQQQCGMAAAQLSQTDALAQVAVEDVTEFVYTLDPLSVTLPQVQGETQLSLTPTRVRTPVVYRENLDMDDISMQELDSLKDLKGEKEEMEFAHSFFIQGQEHLLHQIKRKVTTSVRSSPDFKQDFLPSSEKVNEVLTEMNQLGGRPVWSGYGYQYLELIQ